MRYDHPHHHPWLVIAQLFRGTINMVVGRCPGLSTQHHRLTQTKTLAQAHRTMHYMHIRNMYVQREVEVHYNMIYMIYMIHKIPSQMEAAPRDKLLTLLTPLTWFTLLTWLTMLT